MEEKTWRMKSEQYGSLRARVEYCLGDSEKDEYSGPWWGVSPWKTVVHAYDDTQ